MIRGWLSVRDVTILVAGVSMDWNVWTAVRGIIGGWLIVLSVPVWTGSMILGSLSVRDVRVSVSLVMLWGSV